MKRAWGTGLVIVGSLWLSACSQADETARTAPVASEDAPKRVDAPKSAAPSTVPKKGTDTKAAPSGACDEAEARKGVEMIQSPTVNDAMLPVFALGAAAMACEKHKSVGALVKGLTARGGNREAQLRVYADGVWQNMGLLERSCHAGGKVLNHIGAAEMTGKAAQVALASHCRFVEQGLVTKTERAALSNGYVPVVPIFQSLMKASKVDPKVQRVLLRGILGLRSGPIK